MKNSKFLVSCAVAGMLLGAQAALAEETKVEEGKNGCKGKDGKHKCKGEEEAKTKDAKKKVEGAHACSGPNGCDGKEEEK